MPCLCAAGERRAHAGGVCDPGGVEVVSDPTQSEEPEQSRQRAAEEIQVATLMASERSVKPKNIFFT